MQPYGDRADLRSVDGDLKAGLPARALQSPGNLPMVRVTGEANRYLTDDIILKETLRLLKNNLIATRFMSRYTERALNGRLGGVVNLELPPRLKAADGRTLVKQPMVQKSIPFAIEKQTHVGLSFNSIDRTLSLDKFREKYINSAAVQLAHSVDHYALTKAFQGFGAYAGTPGDNYTHDIGMDARADMTMLGVPDDGMVRAILNPRDARHYRGGLVSVSAPDAMMRPAIERAYLGNVANIDQYETAQMPTWTRGNAAGSITVSGANQSGDAIMLAGISSGTILKKGDIITLAGVFEVNPQTYNSTGKLRSFVVTEDATGAGATAVQVRIAPGINDGNQTALDGDGNTVSTRAYQNVTTLPAAGATVTVLGTAGATYRQNLAFHRDAVMFAAVDIDLPTTAKVASRVRDPDSGLSIAMTGAYDITEMEETFRLDVLVGCHVVYPDLGMRLFGKAA